MTHACSDKKNDDGGQPKGRWGFEPLPVGFLREG